MAVKSPVTARIGRDQHGDFFAGLHGDGMLQRCESLGSVFQFHEHAVQVQRMLHHRVVDKCDPHALAEPERDRFGFGKFLTLETPDESRE